MIRPMGARPCSRARKVSAMARFAAPLLALLTATAAVAQTVPPAPAPSASEAPPPKVETAPLFPPGSQPSPSAPSAAPDGPATPAPQAPAPPPPAATALNLPSFVKLPTLVPPSQNPADSDEVTLAAKPAAVTNGESTWDNGFNTLAGAVKLLTDELAKAGLKPAGHPLTRFIDTNDQNFRFEVLLPVDSVPEGKTELSSKVRFTKTPQGKALRFVHKAPYDEIDSTYEAITAYLDAKGIVVEDSFMEEYVTDLTNQADPELEINIFVTPK